MSTRRELLKQLITGFSAYVTAPSGQAGNAALETIADTALQAVSLAAEPQAPVGLTAAKVLIDYAAANRKAWSTVPFYDAEATIAEINNMIARLPDTVEDAKKLQRLASVYKNVRADEEKQGKDSVALAHSIRSLDTDISSLDKIISRIGHEYVEKDDADDIINLMKLAKQGMIDKRKDIMRRAGFPEEAEIPPLYQVTKTSADIRKELQHDNHYLRIVVGEINSISSQIQQQLNRSSDIGKLAEAIDDFSSACKKTGSGLGLGLEDIQYYKSESTPSDSAAQKLREVKAAFLKRMNVPGLSDESPVVERLLRRSAHDILEISEKVKARLSSGEPLNPPKEVKKRTEWRLLEGQKRAERILTEEMEKAPKEENWTGKHLGRMPPRSDIGI